MQQEIKEIRERLKRKQKGMRWGKTLRRDVVLLASRLYQKHKKWQIVADILGMSKSTLTSLRQAYQFSLPQKEEQNDFAIAVVKQEKSEEKKPELTDISVISPNGFKMIGLTPVRLKKEGLLKKT